MPGLKPSMSSVWFGHATASVTMYPMYINSLTSKFESKNLNTTYQIYPQQTIYYNIGP